jgi:hypothetical protein
LLVQNSLEHTVLNLMYQPTLTILLIPAVERLPVGGIGSNEKS